VEEIERSTVQLEASAPPVIRLARDNRPPLTPEQEAQREERRSQRDRQREKQRERRGERGDRPERSERPEGGRPERAERPERGDRPERAERPERGDRPQRSDRPERQAREERRPDRSQEERQGDRPQRDRADRGRRELDKPRTERGPATAKTDANSFPRAKALASRLGVSVVIPLYNEQESLRELTAAIREELLKLCDKKFEIIYVNDGSTDRSADILKDVVAGSSRVIALTFRRNMGKSAALAVGFKEAKQGIVITMDADLQDDPKEFTALIAKLDEGYDLVTGWKKKRNDPMSKTVPSKFFNSVTSIFSGIKLHDFNCGLKAYRKEVIESLDVYGELHRYLPALAHWKGFRVTEIPVTHHPRKFGKSKFGSSRFFKGFLDLLTIVFVNRYGKRPLHLFGTIGTLLGLVGLGLNIYLTIDWIHGIPLSNRPILLLGALLILVGVQLVSLGLLGEMIVKNSGKIIEAGYIRDRRPPRRDNIR
jgi:glycosyltransferase involved in cell wall biosynthesis